MLSAHTGPGLLGTGALPKRLHRVGSGSSGANTALMLTVRDIVRIVLMVVCVAITLYLLWQLRKPISWLLIAIFLAVALSPPVNWLARRMKRGLAITIVYIGLLLVPILLIAAIVPPLITEGNNFADNVPTYANDVTDYVQKNKRLREIDKDYDITGQAREGGEEASESSRRRGRHPARRGSGNRQLRVRPDHDPGAHRVPAQQRPDMDRRRDCVPTSRAARPVTPSARQHGERGGRLRRRGAHDRGDRGSATYIVLAILGVPFKGPLAVMAGLFSLIPLVGATIAAVLIGIVTVFQDFPTATIVWTIWAIVYQQLENHLLQPQIQKRTVNVHPLITIVAVLFGGTLLGILGAIVAIPVAASIQILLREYVDLRTLSIKSDDMLPPRRLPRRRRRRIPPPRSLNACRRAPSPDADCCSRSRRSRSTCSHPL